MARAGTLIYGGELRQNGFTEFILEEAVALRSRLNTDNIYVENHIAWPLHVKAEVREWKAKYRKVMRTVPYDFTDDISPYINKEQLLDSNTVNNKYIWSRCLTRMRRESIEYSDIRGYAAGKLSGYNGKMPRVLEEVIITLEQKKSLYLLGGFGGVVGDVCKAIASSKKGFIEESLTEEWQMNNNEGYYELQKLARARGYSADYDEIREILTQITVSDLAANAGLSEAEYINLMNSAFTDECAYLVLKGISQK